MILKTIDQLKTAVPTTQAIDNFSDVEPYIRSAELWIKTNILGKTLYDELLVDESSTGENDDLLLLCRSVIGNHAFWDAIPFLDLVLTNNGFAIISAANKVPASKERVDRLREQCLIRRDSEVETLIQYLEDNDQYHDAWKSSPAYSIMSDCLIRTATELSLYAQWTGTRRDFLQLRPKLIQVTMTKLEPAFSKDYIEELIEKQRDEDLTGDDIKVLVLLKFALGSLATDNEHAAKKVAADALRYIDANIESFDTYTDSSEYKARITAGYINETDSPIFSSIF